MNVFRYFENPKTTISIKVPLIIVSLKQIKPIKRLVLLLLLTKHWCPILFDYGIKSATDLYGTVFFFSLIKTTINKWIY